MQERLKINGMGGVILKGDSPLPDKDYLVSITCALKAITKSADEEDITYIMEYLTTECVQQIGSSKKLKVQHGRTKSQILRHLICTTGKLEGQDVDEYYDRRMDELIKLEEEKHL